MDNAIYIHIFISFCCGSSSLVVYSSVCGYLYIAAYLDTTSNYMNFENENHILYSLTSHYFGSLS